MCDSGNLIDVAANVATGGLYGVGKGALQGDPLAAANSLGPFGSVSQPTLGTGPTLSGNLAGVGAGIGGAGGFGGGGFGAADPFSEQAVLSSGLAPSFGTGTPGGLGFAGASTGANIGQQLANYGSGFMQQPAPNLPAPFPQGGAIPGQTPHLGTATGSEIHTGLTPIFTARAAGEPVGTGVSESYLGGNQQQNLAQQQYQLLQRFPGLFG